MQICLQNLKTLPKLVIFQLPPLVVSPFSRYSSDRGNITNDGTWSYTWKNGRQLASMENDIEEWDFSYDASGMRTARTDGIVTYNYTYEGTQLVQMTYAGYALIFTYGINGHPMSVKYNGVDYYYMTNALGDVIGILDGNGNEVVTYIYDAWGNPLPAAGSMAETLGYLNPLRYRGYVYDEETKLYYLQSRYYNPDICRFISADSISYLGADGTPQSYNLFAYCGNNPVMYSDPTGHLAFFVLTAIIGTVVGLSITAAVDYIPDRQFNLHWGWYVGAGLAGAFIGAGIGMAVSYYATGSIASSTSNVMSGLFGKTSLYRTMSADDYATLQSTGKVPPGTETFFSPNAAYASQYNGVTVKFTVRNRTINWLAKIGVRDTSALVSGMYPSMPVVSKGWMATNAFFKTECGIINIGLGFGTALELFNKGILRFSLI